MPSNKSYTTDDGPHMRRCSRCGKSFASRRVADEHIQAIHKGRSHRVSVIRVVEPSLADIAVEAQVKCASGEALDPLEESLLP